MAWVTGVSHACAIPLSCYAALVREQVRLDVVQDRRAKDRERTHEFNSPYSCAR